MMKGQRSVLLVRSGMLQQNLKHTGTSMTTIMRKTDVEHVIFE